MRRCLWPLTLPRTSAHAIPPRLLLSSMTTNTRQLMPDPQILSTSRQVHNLTHGIIRPTWLYNSHKSSGQPFSSSTAVLRVRRCQGFHSFSRIKATSSIVAEPFDCTGERTALITLSPAFRPLLRISMLYSQNRTPKISAFRVVHAIIV